MSEASIYERARAVLEVGPDASERDLKRAYRKKTVLHPPDRDPEGFRRVRSAYELLQQPARSALELILQRVPSVPPPRVELRPVERGAAVRALLRDIAATMDANELLGGQPEAEQGR